ncbi:MAG: ribose-phosphate pyrophosphokinase [Alkalibacterium sp.]|uniref:Ribose-phosphate pyrophosphokinase n=1 Tax=Alkalibacterium gilvum TaxID=1130080 RepID=A0A1H6RQF4_9LACT|nr:MULTISPECIES: ribose-phosphate pyrophosphokinase [Alkalibacterium]MDN6194218.1 ribose-phosphate pyrophosphokinase [Alkalibacterium sp.]MDN6294120.1 ribose-phosphate pyrophosphokinase [Alkalibacterium sp.]MDN6295834.1 ribose-phosphate pyrophosphokinase [Alkalibacterium sp.]MDN6326867.1 ribose-phosphate pyrophosphokinase [Alkalibacterium sp.]MDN6398227.1 ribose-phosphate pyrophosphokinase [Alkalibacterium sp.]
MAKHINKTGVKIFAMNSNPKLAAEIAQEVGVELSKANIDKFSDGEISVNIEESIRGDDVYLIQSTNDPSNDHLMELLIMIDALIRASAGSINVVMPYYGYARQDRKPRPREAITAKVVANMLEHAGIDRLITVDLHAPQIQGFFDIPVDHLSATALLANHFAQKGLDGENIVVVSPDHDGVKRAREIAEQLDSPLAIIDKRLYETTKPNTYDLVGEVEGKDCVLFDDIMDTARTVTKATQSLKKAGAKDVYVCITHAVLSDNAMERLMKSDVKEVIVTNTINLSEENNTELIKLLSVAPILGDAINRISSYQSIKPLFEKSYVKKLMR